MGRLAQEEYTEAQEDVGTENMQEEQSGPIPIQKLEVIQCLSDAHAHHTAVCVGMWSQCHGCA